MTEVSLGIHVFDNIITNPVMYRSRVLQLNFKSVDTGVEVFHGIAEPVDLAPILPQAIKRVAPGLKSSMTFFRKSPVGQNEPNFIHSDTAMGEWTGILYLNQNPPRSDGTTFWRHRQSGLIEEAPGFSGMLEWKDTSKWEPWNHVRAAFNRLLLFPAAYMHSRAIHDNYGEGEEARLIQVVFGTGDLKGVS